MKQNELNGESFQSNLSLVIKKINSLKKVIKFQQPDFATMTSIGNKQTGLIQNAFNGILKGEYCPPRGILSQADLAGQSHEDP